MNDPQDHAIATDSERMSTKHGAVGRSYSALHGVAVLVLVVQAVWTFEWIFIAAGNLNGPEGIGLAIAYSWIFWMIGEIALFPASLFAWAIMFVDGRRPR